MNKPVFFLSLYLVSACALAQVAAQRDYDIDLRLGVNAIYNDNANFSDENDPEAEEPLGELQFLYELALATQVQREWTQVDLGYSASLREFREDSQSEQELWNGNGRITLGNEDFPLEFSLFHSVNEVVRSAANPEDQDDTQRQQRFEATIDARVFELERDTLNLVATYGENEADRLPLNNTEEVDIGLSWQHSLSSISDLTLDYLYSDIDFEFSDQADFRTHTGSVSLVRRLRQLRWGITLGYTQVEPNIGDNYSEPTYGLDLALELQRHTFQLNVAGEITDSAELNNLNNPIVQADDLLVDAGGQDQVLNRQISATWTYGFCSRCLLRTNLIHNDNEFQNLENNDFSNQILNASLNYNVNRRVAAIVGYRSNKIRYDADTNFVGVTRGVTSLTLAYEIITDMQAQVFVEREDWENDAGDQYIANAYGIGLSYTW